MTTTIYDARLWDFLVLNGCYPIAETERNATFRRTPQLKKLMEDYYITTICFKNK